MSHQYRTMLWLGLACLALLLALDLLAVAKIRPVGSTLKTLTSASKTSIEKGKGDKPPKANNPEPAIALPTQKRTGPVPANLQVFVTPGLSAMLESASIDEDTAKQNVTIVTRNVGREKIETLQVVLVDLSPDAIPSKIELRQLRLNSVPTATKTVALKRSTRDPDDSQVLSIVGLTTETRRQKVNVRELINALVTQKTSGAPPMVGITEKSKTDSDSTAMSCYDSFRLVHQIAADYRALVAGTACNQTEQSFSFTFGRAQKVK